jgi:putative endonuclease
MLDFWANAPEMAGDRGIPLAAHSWAMSGTPKMQCGAAAEDLAAEYLRRHGVEVIARNLRCRAGELDLVCLDGAVLVIVEVRQRRGREFGGALASVNRRKQRKIIRAAGFHWQRMAAWRSRAMRFDVIALQGRPGGPPELDWIKDAFRAT